MNWLKQWLDGHLFMMSFRFGGGHTKFDTEKFVTLGKKLVNIPYVFGVEVDPKTPIEQIKALDCSEMTCWLFAQVDIKIPDGSYNQAAACNKLVGDEMLVGDLLFKHVPETGAIHHVGVYLGDRNVLEAKGKQWGVVLTPLSTFTGSSHYAWAGRLKVLCDV